MAIHNLYALKQRTRALSDHEALDMAIQALKKNIEKEPVQTHARYGMGNEYHDFYCPSCDAFLAPEPKGLRWKQEGGWSRCSSCFQKIKWEGGK